MSPHAALRIDIIEQQIANREIDSLRGQELIREIRIAEAQRRNAEIERERQLRQERIVPHSPPWRLVDGA